MSKSVLIWGAPPHVDGNLDFKSALIQSGHNFGNILIGNAVHSFLSKNEILSRDQVASPAEVDERCSHVVIPAANFLWKDFDFGYMLNFLEKTKVPVTIIGVGAQSNDRTTSSPIHPNTLRLMHLISDRSSSLGVRGYYTAEVLAANGIHNLTVIGCPSIYTNRCPTISIDLNGLPLLTAISVNFSRRVVRHAFKPTTMQAVENALLKLAMKTDASFVAQDEIQELSLASDEQVNTTDMCSYFSQSTAESVVDFFKTRTNYFGSVENWTKYIKTRSLSVGTRFHGNLMALINGVPALMIVHDSRTMEMSTLLNIPRLHLSELKEDEFTIETLLARVQSSSFTAFELSYKVLYGRFSEFMTNNGLSHNLIR